MTEVRVSVERRRGCGYRQEGGLYLVGPALSAPCGAFPVELETCPTCDQGIKQSRGWRWVKPSELLRESRAACKYNPIRETVCQYKHGGDCAVDRLVDANYRAGLLWIGAEFYPFPSHFVLEAAELGVSRRIPTLPRDFKLGETWVLLAHRHAITKRLIGDAEPTAPGIFGAFKPTGVEQVVSEDDARDAKKMQRLRDRGIEPVIVRRA